MLTRYRCGHVGRVTGKTVKGFIRVAEIKGQPVEDSSKMCPNCKGSDESAGQS